VFVLVSLGQICTCDKGREIKLCNFVTLHCFRYNHSYAEHFPAISSSQKKNCGKFSSLWREKIMKNCTIENTTEHTTCNKSVVGINFTKSVVYASGLMERGLILKQAITRATRQQRLEVLCTARQKTHLTFKFENKFGGMQAMEAI
jgi:hypothetical protein